MAETVGIISAVISAVAGLAGVTQPFWMPSGNTGNDGALMKYLDSPEPVYDPTEDNETILDFYQDQLDRSERNHQQQLAALARAEEAQRQKEAEAKLRWEEGLARAQGSYEDDLGAYGEKKAYLEGVSADPTKAQGWWTWADKINSEFDSALLNSERGVARRGGTGGALDRIRLDIGNQKSNAFATAMKDVAAQADQGLLALVRPQWTEPTYQGVGSATPAYAPNNLNLPGIPQLKTPVFQSPVLTGAGGGTSAGSNMNFGDLGRGIGDALNGIVNLFGGSQNDPGTLNFYESTVPGLPQAWNPQVSSPWDINNIFGDPFNINPF